MQSIFRIISLLEGISFVLLLFVAMPLKYVGGQNFLVKLLGMPHGVLFLVYVFMSIVLAIELKWKFKKTVEVVCASNIPFGTFYIDKKYLRK